MTSLPAVAPTVVLWANGIVPLAHHNNLVDRSVSQLANPLLPDRSIVDVTKLVQIWNVAIASNGVLSRLFLLGFPEYFP